MSIFDDSVMARSGGPPEDGQYLDGERVGDVRHFMGSDGQAIVIRDHRIPTSRVSDRLLVESTKYSTSAEPGVYAVAYSDRYGDPQ